MVHPIISQRSSPNPNSTRISGKYLSTQVEPSLSNLWLTVGGVGGGGTFGDNGGGSPGKASAVETNPGGKFANWAGVTFALLIGWIIGTGRRLLTIAAPGTLVGDSTLKLGLKKCLSGTLGAIQEKERD